MARYGRAKAMFAGRSPMLGFGLRAKG